VSDERSPLKEAIDYRALEEGGPAAAVRLGGRVGCGRHDYDFAPNIEKLGEVVVFATEDFEKRSRVLYQVGR
jgi:hypothetical protein